MENGNDLIHVNMGGEEKQQQQITNKIDGRKKAPLG